MNLRYRLFVCRLNSLVHFGHVRKQNCEIQDGFLQNPRKDYCVHSTFLEVKPEVGVDQGDQDDAEGQDDLDTPD